MIGDRIGGTISPFKLRFVGIFKKKKSIVEINDNK